MKIDKKIINDDRLIAVAGLTDSEKEILDWLRSFVIEGNTLEKAFPPNVERDIERIIDKLEGARINNHLLFGYEIVRQQNKEGWYLMDSGNNIVGRIQFVDDKI